VGRADLEPSGGTHGIKPSKPLRLEVMPNEGPILREENNSYPNRSEGSTPSAPFYSDTEYILHHSTLHRTQTNLHSPHFIQKRSWQCENTGSRIAGNSVLRYHSLEWGWLARIPSKDPPPSCQPSMAICSRRKNPDIGDQER
jgi:hypothetical protein